MADRLSRKALSGLLGIVLGTSLVLAYKNYSISQARQQVEELAPLSARYLWDLDSASAEDHGDVIIETGDYESFIVRHADGDIFVEVHARPQTGWRAWLSSSLLFPLQQFTSPLLHTPADGDLPQVIGTLTVTRRNTDLSVYLQVLLVVVGGGLLVTNLSERRRRQAAAQRLQLVQEKATRLEAEARLKEREHQLQEKRDLESLGRLAAGVAHDFNNILTVVIGSAEVVEMLAPDDTLRTQARTILGAADRAAALTKQLLAFGRRQVLEPKPTQLNDVIEAFEPILARAAGDRIALNLDLDPDLGIALADPAQLEQVMLNLVVNARDAMPAGGSIDLITRDLLGPAHVEGGADLPPGHWVALAVRDTGAGMDAETAAKVFTPFFTTKAAGKGTGLGLATVFGIVSQSGGIINVQSSPGKGACFTVALPRIDDTSEPREDARTFTFDDDVDLRGTTILLVDDRDEVREVMAGALERHGFLVVSATDGLMALSLARELETPVDLLVTDLTMPGLGGRELAEKLRVDRPDLRVLFVSGDAQAELGDAFISSAVTNVLHKPFGARALVEKVREMLTARPRR